MWAPSPSPRQHPGVAPALLPAVAAQELLPAQEPQLGFDPGKLLLQPIPAF